MQEEEEAAFRMPTVFDGQIQDIIFNSGRYADLLPPINGGATNPNPDISVIVN